MDKYQEYLFRSIRVSTQLAAKKEAPGSNYYNKKYIYDNESGAKDFAFKEGKITLTQNDNYHVHNYEIIISHPKLEDVWIMSKNNKISGEKVDDLTKSITIDFDDKSSSIFISFSDNLADPIEIPIIYVDADKSAWDEKMLKEHKEQLAEIVNINVVPGDSLINVLYKPLNDKYSYCVVTLYYSYTKQGEKDKTYQIMGSFKSEKDKFFIPIVNLGYASYAIVLRQYDNDNKIIYESEKVEFALKRQSTTIYNGGRPTVHIG